MLCVKLPGSEHPICIPFPSQQVTSIAWRKAINLNSFLSRTWNSSNLSNREDVSTVGMPWVPFWIPHSNIHHKNPSTNWTHKRRKFYQFGTYPHYGTLNSYLVVFAPCIASSFRCSLPLLVRRVVFFWYCMLRIKRYVGNRTGNISSFFSCALSINEWKSVRWGGSSKIILKNELTIVTFATHLEKHFSKP